MNKQKRDFLTTALVLVLCLVAAPLAHAAEAGARVQVMLVEAGNSGEGGVDSALRPYAGTLERLFRFKTYKQLARRSLKLAVPGEAATSLAGGQSLSLSAGGAKGEGLMAELTWTRGSQRLLHTRIQLRPGSPVVLGGPRSGPDGGNYLLILVME